MFKGHELYGDRDCFGEAVFNTSHTGYQEILTDPSYYRQIMVFTAPHIGNVGINSEDNESARIRASGAVMRSLSPRPQNWRSEGDLATWLTESEIPLLVGADTRAITLHLRTKGAMRAGIFRDEIARDKALSMVQASPSMLEADLAVEVSCEKEFNYTGSDIEGNWHPAQESGSGLKVAVIDFGVKYNILRELVRRGCQVTVFPSKFSVEEMLSRGFDGVLLSNGPGDPTAVTYGIESVKELIKTGMPIFGICLGHQILSIAAGLKTYKLLFGHRGANHPVRREEDKCVEITSQNHGFAVDPDGLGEDWHITHINLNDGTVEGISHRKLPMFSIQYHPEASPGPHEGGSLFDKFMREMRNA